MWKQMKSIAAPGDRRRRHPGVHRRRRLPLLPVVTSCDGASDLIIRAVASIHLWYGADALHAARLVGSSQMITVAGQPAPGS
jgi:hypothetical protein